MSDHRTVAWVVATCLLLSIGTAHGELRRLARDQPGGAVLGLGNDGAFDAAWATCPTVLREDVLHENGIYRMWYSALCDAKDGPGGIGLATSRDGIHWQRAHGGKPVLTVCTPNSVGPPAALDTANIMGPQVIRVGDHYLMWYTGMPTDRHTSGLGFYRIFLASSPDGITWKRENGGQPVLDLGPPNSPDAVQAATPVVLRDAVGKTFRMWYAAWSPTHNHTICTATSDDGLHWTRDNNGAPITGLNPPTAYGHAIARVGDKYLLLFMSLDKVKGLFAATSTDGQNWRMLNNAQPVLTPGPADNFDDHLIGHPEILVDGETLRVWYTGYQRIADKKLPLRLTIGLAEGRLDKTAEALVPPAP